MEGEISLYEKLKRTLEVQSSLSLRKVKSEESYARNIRKKVKIRRGEAVQDPQQRAFSNRIVK